MFEKIHENMSIKEPPTRRMQSTYFTSTSFPVTESIAVAKLVNNGYVLVTEKSNKARPFSLSKYYQDLKWYSSNNNFKGEIDYSASTLWPGSTPPVYNPPTDGSFEFTTPAVTGLGGGGYVVASMYDDHIVNGAIKLKAGQGNLIKDINTDDLNADLVSGCSGYRNREGILVYNQPYSSSIIGLPNGGFLISWTQKKISCFFTGDVSPVTFGSLIATSIHIAYFNSENTFVNQIEIPSGIVIRGDLNFIPRRASYHVALTSLIYLYDSNFLLAYHLSNSTMLTAKIGKIDQGNSLLSSDLKTLFQVSINGNRFVVRLAKLLNNPIFVWESEDSNRNSQIFIKLYISKEEQITRQVSTDDSEIYYNINPAVIVLENNNIVVIWHRYLKENDHYVGLMMQKYTSDLTCIFPEPMSVQNMYSVRYLSPPLESFQSPVYNFPQITELDNNNFIIHWLDTYRGLASVDTLNPSQQGVYFNNPNKNIISDANTAYLGIITAIGAALILIKILHRCLKYSQHQSRYQYIEISNDAAKNAVELINTDSKSSIVNPFSTFQDRRPSDLDQGDISFQQRL